MRSHRYHGMVSNPVARGRTLVGSRGELRTDPDDLRALSDPDHIQILARSVPSKHPYTGGFGGL